MANYNINNRPILLEEGDGVDFDIIGRVLHYNVEEEHLCGVGCCNDYVFAVLGMDEEKKYEFASSLYGYDTKAGIWPVFRDSDFAALTRLVNGIFLRIEALQSNEDATPKEYTNENRPEKLKVDDVVIFTVGGKSLRYNVTPRLLNYFDGMDGKIFADLGISNERRDFATKAYGYRATDDCFPQWKLNDMDAATRLVNALFEKAEEWNKEKKDRPKEGERVVVLSGEYKGRVGILIRDDETGIPFHVEFDDGDHEWFEEGDIRVDSSMDEVLATVDEKHRETLKAIILHFQSLK